MSTLGKHPVLAVVVVGSLLGPVLLWLLLRSQVPSGDGSATEAPPLEQPKQQPVLRLEESTGLRLASGAFHAGAHETQGDAAVFELSRGKRILRLTAFETATGPDLRVLLIAAGDATDDAAVARSAPIELGRLRSTSGDQTYPIPAGVDLERYRAVTIWSQRLGVSFGTAPLR
jgi:hypothetical protein